MNQDQQDLLTIGIAVEASPLRDQAREAVKRLAESLARKRKVLEVVQEAIQQLRLDTKYLVFDLEATRRERDQARGQS